jgi:hypothetical protein
MPVRMPASFTTVHVETLADGANGLLLLPPLTLKHWRMVTDGQIGVIADSAMC